MLAITFLDTLDLPNRGMIHYSYSLLLTTGAYLLCTYLLEFIIQPESEV